MSNMVIVIVCASILCAGWLLRRYQDRVWPFASFADKTHNKNQKKKASKPKASLHALVSRTFPKHIIKQKVGDSDFIFVCEPAIGNADAQEVAIIKVKTVDKKQLKTMGRIVSVTYKKMPSQRQLKKDLAHLL